MALFFMVKNQERQASIYEQKGRVLLMVKIGFLRLIFSYYKTIKKSNRLLLLFSKYFNIYMKTIS
jgi:hypothetical protein